MSQNFFRTYLLALNNHNNLCSGSNDNSIKIWDISSGQCTKTFCSRTGIRALLQIEQNIVSGSDDKTFKVWQLSSSGQRLKTFPGHSNYVYCLYRLSDGYLCSGSGDNSIKFWDVRSEECIKTLERRHSGSVM